MFPVNARPSSSLEAVEALRRPTSHAARSRDVFGVLRTFARRRDMAYLEMPEAARFVIVVDGDYHLDLTNLGQRERELALHDGRGPVSPTTLEAVPVDEAGYVLPDSNEEIPLFLDEVIARMRRVQVLLLKARLPSPQTSS